MNFNCVPSFYRSGSQINRFIKSLVRRKLWHRLHDECKAKPVYKDSNISELWGLKLDWLVHGVIGTNRPQRWGNVLKSEVSKNHRDTVWFYQHFHLKTSTCTIQNQLMNNTYSQTSVNKTSSVNLRTDEASLTNEHHQPKIRIWAMSPHHIQSVDR